MKRRYGFIIILISILAIACISCGKDKAGSSSDGDGSTISASETAKFLADYETFIDSYCILAGKLKKAPLAEKAALMQKWAQEAIKITEFFEMSAAYTSSFTDEQAKKLDELGDRAKKCGDIQ